MIDELTRLVSPPDDPEPMQTPDDLPSDYRALVARYGPGAIAGCSILTPGHPNRYLDMERQTAELRGILKDSPYEPEALIPWGVDESGNTLWWLTAGEPDAWPVIANEARGPEWQRFDGGAVAFLVALLSGAETSVFLSIEGDDFEPYSASSNS